ncbi:MAG: DUF5915 domain-containing protein [Balneolaceae bacterium]|nr:DUF5915 domain-containing protein [Balneolaceae bacterium]
MDDDSGIVRKSAKPNFPVLGKKMGSKMKSITPKVQQLNTEQITKFEETGSIELDLGDDGIVTVGKRGSGNQPYRY